MCRKSQNPSCSQHWGHPSPSTADKAAPAPSPDAPLVNEALTFGGGQLGSDVHVAQVSLAALHGLVGGWRSFARHFPLLIDLEAALLVNLSPIVNAQGSKAALALAPIPIPTGDAFTHTLVGNHLQLPFIVCKREESRKNIIPSLTASARGNEIMRQSNLPKGRDIVCRQC